MAYANWGIIILQFIFLGCGGYLLRKMVLDRRVIQNELRNHKRYFLGYMDTLKKKYDGNLEKLDGEMKDVDQRMSGFLQNQISWRTVKKELPDPRIMVLLLKDKTKSEHPGFLNDSKEGWVIHALGKRDKKVSLSHISHWKHLVDK